MIRTGDHAKKGPSGSISTDPWSSFIETSDLLCRFLGRPADVPAVGTDLRVFISEKEIIKSLLCTCY